MKIGLIADIHGNLAALNAVMTAIRAESCDAVLCMGDVVGYGPDPEACARFIMDNRIPMVRGNHETWITADRTPEGIGESVRANIRWTRAQLPPDVYRFLAAQPHRHTWRGVGMVHATNAPSRSWPFVRGPRRLAASFAHQPEDLCFHGHTHVPAVGIQSKLEPESAEFIAIPDDAIVKIDRKRRAFVNPGSVGQPRDGDHRAAFAICHLRARTIQFFRIPYDVEDTIARMRDLKLSETLIKRLQTGR